MITPIDDKRAVSRISKLAGQYGTGKTRPDDQRFILHSRYES
jgi:hypothetical protein